MLMNVASAFLIIAQLFVASDLRAQNEPLPMLHLASRIVQDVRIVGLEDSNWKFTSAGEGSKEFSSQQLVRWGSWRGAVDRPVVWLSDGSWITGEIDWSENQLLTVRNRWFQVPAIPIRSVRGIVLKPAASILEWVNLQHLLQGAQGEDDVVWLSDQRRLSGVVDWSSLAGSDELKLSSTGQEVTVRLEEVVAIVASPALFGEPTTAAIQIGLSDGSLLNASDIKATDKQTKVTLQSTLALDSLDRTSDFVSAVTYLCASNIANVQQLDQLKPAKYSYVSDSQLEFNLGVGRDVYGNLMQIGSQRRAGLVFSGLALHSSAQATYRWNRSPGRFLAEVRLAESENRLGNVICKVLLVRGGKIETATEFPLSARNAQPQVVDVDLLDAQLVVLVVEKAEQGQFGDHVLWLDARFASMVE